MSEPMDSLEIQVEVTARDANSQLNILIENLNRVNSSLRSVSSGMGTFKTGTSNIQSASSSIFSFSNSAISARKSTASLTSAFTSLYAKIFSIKMIIESMQKIITSPLDFLETVNYYNVAMRQIGTESQSQWQTNGYNSAETYADSFQTRLNDLNDKMTGISTDKSGNTTFTNEKNLGLDLNGVMNAEAQYGQMAKSLGVTGETAIATAKAFTMLGEDWSSLRNISLDSAWTKFSSVLAGQSRAVQSLGISTQVATLQEYAYKYGITDAVQNMNQAEKTQLRLLAVLDQSKVAFGDLANTINSPRNQIRLLQNNFSVLARTIGNLFVPVIMAVLPYLNALTIAAQRLFSWLGNLMGIKMDQVNSSIGGANNQMSDLSDSTDDVSNNLDKAASSAKKLTNVLSPIDELNILKYSSGSGSSGDGGASAVSSGYPQLDAAIQSALANYQSVWDAAFERMNNKAQTIADNIVNAFKAKDYSGIGTYIGTGVANALNSIDWNAVYNVAGQFGSGFAQFLNGLITPELFSSVGKTIAGALNTAVELAFSFTTTLNWTQIGESIASGVNTFFSTFDFSKLSATVNAWVGGVATMLYTAFKNTNWISVFGGIATFIGDLNIGTVALLIGGFTLKMAGNILTSTIFKDYLLKKLIDMIATSFGGSELAAGAAEVAIPLTAILVIDFLAITFGDKILQSGLKPLGESQADILGNLMGIKPEDIAKVKKQWDEAIKDFNPYQDIINHVSTSTVGVATFDPSKIINWDGVTKIKDTINSIFSVDNGQQNTVSEWFTNTEQGFSDLGSALDQSGKDFQDWWTNDVQPQFTAEKWNANYDTIKSQLQSKWGEVVDWWNKSALVVLWNDDISPYFTAEKWNTLYDTMKTSIQTKWGEVTDWWNNLGPVKWFNDTVTPMFSKEKWSFSGIGEGIKAGFSNAIQGVKQIWNNFATFLNEKLNFSWNSIKVLGKEVVPSGSVNLGKIPTFSTGGFPEDGIFMANSQELVGQFSNGKTAVANNGQIVDGIKSGVIDAMMEVFMATRNTNTQSNQQSVITINVDGSELGRSAGINIDKLVQNGQLNLGFI